MFNFVPMISLLSARQFLFPVLITFALLLPFAFTLSVYGAWNEASSTALINSTIDDLSSALYNILVIIIPVAVAVGIFFFAYNWVRGIFRNRR